MSSADTLRTAAVISGALLATCPSAEYAEPANHAAVQYDAHRIVSSIACNAVTLRDASDIPTPSNRIPLRLEAMMTPSDPDMDAITRVYPSRASYLLHFSETSIVGFDVRTGRKDTHDTNSIKRSFFILSNDPPVEKNSKNTVIFKPLKNHRKGDHIAVYLKQTVDIDNFHTIVTGLNPCGILENTGEGEQPWILHPTPDELQPLVYEEERLS